MIFDFSTNAYFRDGISIEFLTSQKMLGVYLVVAFLGAAYWAFRLRKAEKGQSYRRSPWQNFKKTSQYSNNVAPLQTADRNLVGSGDARYAVNQLEFVSRVEFETVRLLNKEEYPLLILLERLVEGKGTGHRVMAQTSLGEILRPKQGSASKQDIDNAFASINSKRLDFAIIDRTGLLALAIEYQGSGHYSGKAFMRDAVKREALRKAGVKMLEVPTGFDAETVKKQVMKALGLAPTR